MLRSNLDPDSKDSVIATPMAVQPQNSPVFIAVFAPAHEWPCVENMSVTSTQAISCLWG